MWKCKYCGGEILIEVTAVVNYDFIIDKNGEPDELYPIYSPIDEYIKCEGCSFDRNYKCSECDAESEELEEIAEWEE